MNQQKSTVGRVLIVDDEQDLREILVEEFKASGFDVTETESGQSAKEILSDSFVDIVVSDMRMPGMGGVDLLKWTRGLAHPPGVILISGYLELSESEYFKMGASALFLKPFRIKDVVASAHQILLQHRGAA